MGILGNFSRVNLGATRYVGGNALAMTRGNLSTNRRGLWLNYLRRDGAAAILPLVGKPHGYYPPACWRLPIIAGAMTAASEVVIDAMADGAMGMGLQAAATLSVDAEAVGGLIAGGVATAVIDVSGSAAVTATVSTTASAIIDVSATAQAGAMAWGVASATLTISGTANPLGLGWCKASTEYGTGDVLTAEQVAAAVWAQALEAGITAAEFQRIMAAALAGAVSGMGTNAPIFRGLDGTTDRITATTDAAGNRLTVTLDGAP